MAWLWGKQTSEKKPHVWTAFLFFKIEWTRTKCSVQISLKLSISASLICALLSNIVLEEPIFRAFTCTESLWKYQKWHFPSQVSLNSKTGSYLSLFLCPKAFLFQFATSNVILWFSSSWESLPRQSKLQIHLLELTGRKEGQMSKQMSTQAETCSV